MAALTDLQLQMMFKGLSDAALYCPFNGDADDDAGSLTPSTESGGIIYDDDTIDGMAKIGDAIQLAEVVTNQLFNPRFENNITDGWDAAGDGTFSQDTSKSKVGAGCFKLVAGTASTYLITEVADVYSLADGATIILSGWIWASGPGTIYFQILDVTTPGYPAPAYASTTGGWEFLKTSFTNSTGGAVNIRVRCGNMVDDSSTIAWFDALQLEVRAYVTPYCDGALGTGHTWSGAAHNSTSARTKTELDYSLTAGTAFTVGCWLTPHTLSSETGADSYLWWWYNNANDSAGLYYDASSNDLSVQLTVDSSANQIDHADLTRHTAIHAVVTWDGATLKFYVNNVLIDSSTEAGTWGTALSTFYIGSDENGANQCNSYLDELVVLDYALSASEVDLLYNEGAVNSLPFAGVWTNALEDVRAKEGIKGGGGIKGNSPKHRVASTGTLQFYMDNSIGNSVATAGYYSPDHSSCRSGFDLGIETRLRWSYGGQDYYPWRGRIYDIGVEAGKYGPRRTKVMAHDWIGAAMRHKIGLLPVETSVRSDTAMATIIGEMEHAPQITSYGTGQETFSYFPDQTKDEKSSIAAVAQKICMSEFGFLIRIGDTTTGETVLYQNRHARVTNFTLEATITDVWLTDLKAIRSQQHMANVVKAITYPREVGSSAEDLFTLQTAIEIAAGETKTYTARYSDPDNRDSRLSAHTLEDPEGANELANRGFETDATSWTAAAGGAFAQSDDQAKHDSYSGKLTSGAGGANTYYVESDVWSGPVQNDVIYYQVYVLASDVWPSSILVEISEYDAGDVIGTTTTLDTIGTSTSGAWIRYSGTHTCVDGDCAKVKIRVGTGRAGAHDFSGGAVNLYIDEAYLIDDAALIFEFSSSDVGGGDLNGDLVLIESTLGGNSSELVWENVGSVAGFVTIQKIRGLAIRVYDTITYEAVIDSTLVAKHERRELELRLSFQDDPLVGEDFALVTRDKLQDPLTMVRSGTFVANKHATPMAAAMTVEPGDRIKYTETQTGINEEYFVNGKEFIIYPDAEGFGTLWMTWFVVAASVEAFWLIGTVGASEIGSYTWVGW